MKYTDYNSKLLGHVDALAAIKEGRVHPPVNAEIDLSNRCSLGCEWCHFSHTHTKGPFASPDNVDVGDLMHLQLIADILRQLKEYGVKSVTWTGGGEPLLHPSAESVFAECHYLNLDQGIYTSGVHIDDNMAETLGDCMKWVYVSLDAVDAESYKEAKGVDKFQAACDGIRKLAGGKVTVGVGFLLTEKNYTQIKQMAELAQSLRANYVQFRPAIRFDNNSPSVAREDRSWVNDIDWIPSIHGIHVEWDGLRFADYRDWKGHGYPICHWSSLQTVITPDGQVWICCNKRGYENASLGDLNKESFETIWNRRKPAQVTDQCRVMCRGHMPNKAINAMLEERPHGNFI